MTQSLHADLITDSSSNYRDAFFESYSGTDVNLSEFLNELRNTNGLPEHISTEAQLWDEIMKKIAYSAPELLFPLIHEVHGRAYPKGTTISPLATEYSVQRSDTKQISSIRADITVLIGGVDIYHFECEIKNNKSMIIRMFEYDMHIALSYTNSTNSSIPELNFPHSAVLYLGDNGNIPEHIACRINLPDGGSFLYNVPTVKVQSYSLEDIRQKHLSVLIPFLPIRLRKDIKKNNNTRETLTSFYDEIILILRDEVVSGYLSETNCKTIISLLGKAFIRVTYHNPELLEEVVRMTEPLLVLEYEIYEKRLKEKLEKEYQERYEKEFDERYDRDCQQKYEKEFRERYDREYQQKYEKEFRERYDREYQQQRQQHQHDADQIAALKAEIERLRKLLAQQSS